ncbi:hypothetical protein [Ornithinibacillus sp. JPR2-1]|uniref:hypothetical protein n=1 Tax=Ornithinibacillus sp. JPR2-1 TaxID=2094019 RepID=UPI0031D8D951
MNIEQAREEIKKLEDYIEMIETYEADTFEKEAIYEYVLIENVNKVATVLNERGHRIGNRKVVGKDVSDIIRDKPIDHMHEYAKKLFRLNRKRSNKW